MLRYAIFSIQRCKLLIWEQSSSFVVLHSPLKTLYPLLVLQLQRSGHLWKSASLLWWSSSPSTNAPPSLAGCSRGVSRWGILQSSKPSEHFGGLWGCAGHGEFRRGSLVRRSLPPGETVVVEASRCVLNAVDVFQGDKTWCAEEWNCLGQKETQGCLSCIGLFLAVSCFQNG